MKKTIFNFNYLELYLFKTPNSINYFVNINFLLIGGYDRGECLKIVESYNPSLNSWAELTPMKEPRGRFDVAVVKGKVYAVGGSNGTTELSTVEMYDPETGKWSRISSLPLARCNTGEIGRNCWICCFLTFSLYLLII